MYYRSAPYPLFGTFDATDFQTVCTRRPHSDTPLQALTVANDPAFVELAQGLAARVLREVPDGDAKTRIRRASALCLCREPGEKELAILRAYDTAQLADFTADTAAANKLLSPALAKTPRPPKPPRSPPWPARFSTPTTSAPANSRLPAALKYLQ